MFPFLLNQNGGNHMWIILGVLALVFTIMNLYSYFFKKDFHIFMVFALFFTALTLCAQYQMIASWSLAGDWSAIEDVAPTMAMILWIFVIISFIINVMPLLLSYHKN